MKKWKTNLLIKKASYKYARLHKFLPAVDRGYLNQEIRRNGYIYSKKIVLYASFNDEMWHLGNEHTKINN